VVGIVRGTQVVREYVVIALVGFLLGRVLANVLDVLVHLEGLLVDVVRELLLLVTLGARAHVSHYNIQILDYEQSIGLVLWGCLENSDGEAGEGGSRRSNNL
jgi:hypothetical protein